MIIIGVTGNSGAGKTTVSTIIKNNSGALVIDADEVSKSLMEPGNEYYDKVVEIFGPKIILKKHTKSKGKIHRAELAKIIFSDEEKREQMNKLTFKYVGKEIKKIILENKDKEIIVLDVPLLYEGKFDKICNYVIAVVADEDAKMSRLKERDRLPKDQIRNRLSVQKDEEFYRENADFIVENNSKSNYFVLVKETLKIIHKIKKDEANKIKKESASTED